MPDMIVPLYRHDWIARLSENRRKADALGVKIHRALSPDRDPILAFIREKMNIGYAGEAAAAFSNNPPTIYIALRGKELLGIACYDATAKGYFGPIELVPEARGQGIGTALLDACLFSMREAGYGYAIIGWATSAAPFYEKTVGALPIPDWTPQGSVYGRFIKCN